ncbi:GNAT family N-acetyltransferase [Shewanella maritima]|uniref:GNAT family N-acetyltransferase n=1 Tax=Shewanella maritima TaxID=2520507 RepID=UPI003735D6DB
MIPAPTLTVEQLQIRPFTEADLVSFARYRAIPEVARYQSWSNYSLLDAKRLLANSHYDQFAQAGKWYQLAIVDKNSQQLLGDVALHFIDDGAELPTTHQQVEIGFTLAPEYQGKGIASLAVKRVLAYLFNELSKHRVVATTDTRNVASWQLLQRLGFRREAHFKHNIFFKGEWGDEYQYALLATEFEAT